MNTENELSPKSHINNSLKPSLTYLTLFCLSVLPLELVQEKFMESAKRNFANFHNLSRAAKVRHYLEPEITQKTEWHL